MVPNDLDTETMRIFEEANEAVGGAGTAIRLVAPPGKIHSGFVRFDTLLSGDEIDHVVFYLDAKAAVTKNRPPFNVEIDLGPYPQLRSSAPRVSTPGQVVADDQILLNGGEHRFSLQLVEPRSGRRYDVSLTARAEIEVPNDRALERVEFFLDERRVATLFQKPFVQPIRLPSAGAASYVRAVAYLADGNSTEDVVFVNAPDTTERMDVQFVELYAAALDGEGRLIEGLDKETSRCSRTASSRRSSASTGSRTCRSTPPSCSTTRPRWVAPSTRRATRRCDSSSRRHAARPRRGDHLQPLPQPRRQVHQRSDAPRWRAPGPLRRGSAPRSTTA